MKRFLAIVAAALVMSFAAGAQTPGWYVGVQGGFSYATSNNWNIPHFQHLNVPNVALDLGYNVSPVFGLRGTISGPVSNYPAGSDNKTIKKFNYAELGLDATFDIFNIFNERDDRFFSPYAFVGGAGYYRFKGENADKGAGLGFRFGLGANIRLSEKAFISLELVDNALNNKFNTLDDNVYAFGNMALQFKRPFPWDANIAALIGLKFNLGD